MTLSCVIPSYNSAKTIQKTIESIKKARIPNIEIVVVDDSTDNTVEIIRKKFPEVKLFVNKLNRGLAFARNQCITLSKGDYILFIDSDVWVMKGAIKKMLRYIEKYDIVYPTIKYENGFIMAPCTNEEKKFPGMSAVFMIRRDALKKTDSLFDETIGYYVEDSEFFSRCHISNLSAFYCEDAVAIHVNPTYSPKNEKRFYLQTRNTTYALLKLRGFPLRRDILGNHFLLDFLRYAILNYAWFIPAPPLKGNNAFEKFMSGMRHRHVKISKKGRPYLFLLLAKAVIWNLLYIGTINKKRNDMLRFVKNIHRKN